MATNAKHNTNINKIKIDDWITAIYLDMVKNDKNWCNLCWSVAEKISRRNVFNFWIGRNKDRIYLNLIRGEFKDLLLHPFLKINMELEYTPSWVFEKEAERIKDIKKYIDSDYIEVDLETIDYVSKLLKEGTK